MNRTVTYSLLHIGWAIHLLRTSAVWSLQRLSDDPQAEETKLYLVEQWGHRGSISALTDALLLSSGAPKGIKHDGV